MTIGTVASRGDRRHFTIRFTSHHAGSSVYGVVVQAIARHADLDVTMRIYAHRPIAGEPAGRADTRTAGQHGGSGGI
jgi:hypothetical protein